MSHFRADDGTHDETGFSLAEAVEDVSRHGHSQVEDLREKEGTLSSLQAALSEKELKGEMAEQELRSTVREILLLEGDMEHLERQTTGLHDRCVAVAKENAELHFLICNEEEKACMALERFNTYRKKMEGHRAAVLHTARQTEAHQELEEKRTLVQKLRQKMEDLNQDLNNPNGNTVHMAKREIYALKEKISMAKKDIAEKRKRLQEEHETHTQIKRDIAIQNKRYEAIVKRLHCQLSRTQAVHRQMSEDIYNKERQLAELKKQWESSQGPAGSGH